jgi:phage terminase large subunit-like protein
MNQGYMRAPMPGEETEFDGPDGERYVFDGHAADLAVRFFEKLLVHTKGALAGRPFKLMGWQKDEIIRPLFGWKRAGGVRRFRRAYIEIPRKNGKSTLAAGMALLGLFADNEYGAEVYSAAGDRDQAAIVFRQAQDMVRMSPALQERSQVFTRSIVVQESMSVYRVLSADAPTKHGLNASMVIFDELHVQPNRELWDVLSTSQGARAQPLLVAITTAGYDRQSICWEQHEYARQVLDGIIPDPTFFGFMAAARENDDWLDPEVWKQANPGIGDTVRLEYLEEEARRAKQTPAYQNTFRRLHLNQWTQQETRWLDMAAWDVCGSVVDVNLLAGAACYGGLDLASTSDVASLALVFASEPDEEERYQVVMKFWIPESAMIERARRDRVPYDVWVRQGLITATEGNVIDYARIVKDIEELMERYNIREIAFDRWGAFQVSQQLSNAGITMVGFGQGFVSMSPPTKELLRVVLDERIAHAGNPVLRWMADNLMVRQDPAGNVKPDKAKSREKIDGMVALIMGLDRAIRNRGVDGSVYESRGILTL